MQEDELMRQIMVINSKGGSGKSSIATSLAAYYAKQGKTVALADYDPQQSSLDWLARRPATRNEIVGLRSFKDGLRKLPRSSDVLIIDAPAGASGAQLSKLAAAVQTIIVPVLPSPIDMAATDRFLTALMKTPAVSKKKTKVGIVANRVRDNTLVSEQLDAFITKQKAPYVTWFREAQNYVRAYMGGLGVHEMPEYRAWAEWQQWEPLVKWLDSAKSRGRG